MRSVRKFKRRASNGRKIAIEMAAPLAGTVLAVLILPGFIDWNRFKAPIENQTSSLTGRQVRIDGPISFRMLPRPALSLENATIANRPGAAEPLMLSLERLDAQLGMLALLSGKIQMTNFRLMAPVTANPAPEPAQAAPQTTPPAESSAKKVINRILNGIVRDKPR